MAARASAGGCSPEAAAAGAIEREAAYLVPNVVRDLLQGHLAFVLDELIHCALQDLEEPAVKLLLGVPA